MDLAIDPAVAEGYSSKVQRSRVSDWAMWPMCGGHTWVEAPQVHVWLATASDEALGGWVHAT